MRAATQALLAVGLCWNTAYSQEPDWKLTLGEYTYIGYAGTDTNLRWRAHDTSAWVGVCIDFAGGMRF